MKEKKKLVKFGILGVTGALLVSGGYLYFNPEVADKVVPGAGGQIDKIKDKIDIMLGVSHLGELSAGASYSYSEKDIEASLELAKQLKEERIAELDLKIGQNYVAMLGAKSLNKPYESVKNYPSFWLPNYAKYDRHGTKASEVFNDDLSLKNPEYFTGFVDIGEIRFGKASVSGDTYWEFKDAELNSYNKDIGGFIVQSDAKSIRTSTEVREWLEKTEGGQIEFGYNKYMELTQPIKKHSNVLFTLFDKISTHPMYGNNIFAGILTRASNSEPDYDREVHNDTWVKGFEYMPRRFNYYAEISKEDHYAYYYPVGAKKIDDTMYVIDIEVDRPIGADQYGTIAQEVTARFLLNYSNDGVDISEKKFDLIVNIQPKEKITSGVINEGMATTVTTDIYVNQYGAIIEAGNSAFTYSTPYWYPNEQAKAMLKEFFAITKKAYDADDKNYSMIKTLESVAKKHDMTYMEAVSIFGSFITQQIPTFSD